MRLLVLILSVCFFVTEASALWKANPPASGQCRVGNGKISGGKRIYEIVKGPRNRKYKCIGRAKSRKAKSKSTKAKPKGSPGHKMCWTTSGAKKKGKRDKNFNCLAGAQGGNPNKKVTYKTGMQELTTSRGVFVYTPSFKWTVKGKTKTYRKNWAQAKVVSDLVWLKNAMRKMKSMPGLQVGPMSIKSGGPAPINTTKQGKVYKATKYHAEHKGRSVDLRPQRKDYKRGQVHVGGTKYHRRRTKRMASKITNNGRATICLFSDQTLIRKVTKIKKPANLPLHKNHLHCRWF